MPSATIDASEEASKATVRDRVVDACRQTAHFSREARLLKSLASDAVEDGVHAAKRAIPRSSAASRNSRTSQLALTRIDEAQRMAGQLNQDANALAADAAKTINDVLGSAAKP